MVHLLLSDGIHEMAADKTVFDEMSNWQNGTAQTSIYWGGVKLRDLITDLYSFRHLWFDIMQTLVVIEVSKSALSLSLSLSLSPSLSFSVVPQLGQIL